MLRADKIKDQCEIRTFHWHFLPLVVCKTALINGIDSALPFAYVCICTGTKNEKYMNLLYNPEKL